MKNGETFESSAHNDFEYFALDSAFVDFELACERNYQNLWFWAVETRHNGEISDWPDRTAYVEETLLDYLRFILRCVAFRSMRVVPFESMDHIWRTLGSRCCKYWIENLNLDFYEWLGELPSHIDLSSVITADNPEGCFFPDRTSFQQAIGTARYISIREDVEVVLYLAGCGWAMYRVSPVTDPSIYFGDSIDISEDYGSDDGGGDYDEFVLRSEAEEVLSDISAETRDYAEGLVRSDEEGWFYAD